MTMKTMTSSSEAPRSRGVVRNIIEYVGNFIRNFDAAAADVMTPKSGEPTINSYLRDQMGTMHNPDGYILR
jgi:hypothetical protein